MNEITNEEYTQIKKFADGLKECIEAKRKAYESESILAAFAYVLVLINLHLKIKELELNTFGNNLQKTREK